MDAPARRDYEILTAIADGRHVTQRVLALRLGIVPDRGFLRDRLITRRP